MQLPIDFVMRSISTTDPDTLRAHTARRLAFALRHFGDRARRLTVRCDDVNGPRRGIDARCSISLVLRNGRHVAVDAVTAWPFSSITLAARRLGTTIRRDMDRAQRRARRPRRKAFDPSST